AMTTTADMATTKTTATIVRRRSVHRQAVRRRRARGATTTVTAMTTTADMATNTTGTTTITDTDTNTTAMTTTTDVDREALSPSAPLAQYNGASNVGAGREDDEAQQGQRGHCRPGIRGGVHSHLAAASQRPAARDLSAQHREAQEGR